MKGPTPSASPLPGHDPIREPGFTYLPRFLSADDVTDLADYFASLAPQWENRHASESSRGPGPGSLTRPVYWLGAWQFAALGYYSEPDHTHQKCIRAEPMPEVLMSVLRRLRPELAAHGDDRLPNTCLINVYGQLPKRDGHPPVDRARLRMHRDSEPGPVAMLSIGQPAQFEFVEPHATSPFHSQWVRNRSIVIISGPRWKDELYHRVTRVRYGQQPVLSSRVENFEVRRFSVSFRHVPESHILDFGQLDPEAREVVRPHLQALAEHRPHYARQLATETSEGT